MDESLNRVALKVWGSYACFTRPEMKAERVSYEVMTPSAARGILEAVYWKPQMRWRVEAIHVLNPIRFGNVRRNELGGRGPSGRTLARFMEGKESTPLAQIIEEDRQQRATTLLVDVAYVIRASFVILDASDPGPKHYEMFKRRAVRGQCFHRPYLGCREFAADFCWYEGEVPKPDSSLLGRRELGLMLKDFDFTSDHTPHYFEAVMTDGIITVPHEELRLPS